MRAYALGAAVVLPLLLAVPPVQRALEASMTAQMLLQIPLLALAGKLLNDALPERAVQWIGRWNDWGVTGLIMASLAVAYWMLPLSLDAAASDAATDVGKFVSVPLLIGLPLALSWPRMPFVFKGMVLLEALATLFRLGWLYMISPVRLCNNYQLDDQQRLGEYLLAIGAALSLWTVWRLVWGHIGPARSAT